jgi:hypothetical protein
MALVLSITVCLTAAALAIFTTALAGPILSARWGLHALWIAPVLAVFATQMAILIVSSWFAFLVGDSNYLRRSIPMGLGLMPWAGLSAIASTAIALHLRRFGSGRGFHG